MYNKLSMKEKISYGLGDMASCMVLYMLVYYAMYFYTDIVGISVVAAGNILLIARVFDALNDPLVGLLVDRTNTKYGKARPYILWFAIPFGIIGTLTFMIPEISNIGKILYASLSYMIFTLIYTLVNLPYGAMMPLMTKSSEERSKLSMFRMLGATLGGLVVSGFAMVLVKAIGKQNEKLGYSVTMGIFCVIAVVLFMIVFKNCKEQVKYEQTAEKTPVKESIKALWLNRPWIIVAANTMMTMLKLAFPSTVVIYYVINCLDGTAVQSSIFLVVSNVGVVIGNLVAPKIVEKLGNKKTAMLSIVLPIIGYVGGFLAGKNFIAALIFFGIASIPTGILYVLDYAMLADTVEYGEWKTGVRTDGLSFSAHSFAQKFTSGIGGALVGYVLSFIGYQSGTEVQTMSTQRGILFMMYAIPLVITVIQLFVMSKYNLDEKTYAKVVAELEARNNEQAH